MKIGIVTLLDNKNYGNRWQNYAMNELLRSNGIETENIYFWKRSVDREGLPEKIKRLLPIRFAYKIHILRTYKIYNFAMLKRVLKFSKFTLKYMGANVVLIDSYDEISKRIEYEKYEYFAVGSDQVWNPYYLADPIYFLTFVEKKKRLAFMASFGSETLPKNQINNYTKWIMEMAYISVREANGADLVRKLTGKSADVFFDPTLLLEQKKWIKLSEKPKKVFLPSEYAVSFMFDAGESSITALCRKKNMELIILNSKVNQNFFSIDPSEMLYIINHASMVFTDSFHIMALSIKLNKQLYVFERPGFEYMFCRLESVLERLQITQCIFRGEKNFQWNPISESEFQSLNQKLEIEKTAFIKTVFKVTGFKKDELENVLNWRKQN